MGRIEKSKGLAPPHVRRELRAKQAKATIQKDIPKLLASNARARAGVEAARLISDPPKQEGPVNAKSRKAVAKEGVIEQKVDVAAPALRLFRGDAISTAQQLLQEHSANRYDADGKPSQHSKIGILNMGSPLRPGGGVLNGAQASEEFLCTRTTLLTSLQEQFYRLPEVGGILTQNVLVFRDAAGNNIPKHERFFVDMVTAGMLRFPELEQYVDDVPGHEGDNSEGNDDGSSADDPSMSVANRAGSSGTDGEGRYALEEESESRSTDDTYVHGSEGTLESLQRSHLENRMLYANESDRQLVIQKMRAVLRMFQRSNVKRVILGAWGCGAYGNPIEEIANAWKKVLLGTKNHPRDVEPWSEFEEIAFAVSDGSMAARFGKAFGSDLCLQSSYSEAIDEAELRISSQGKSRELEELTSKIGELELQQSQSRHADLAARIGKILDGLRNTLDSKREASAEDGLAQAQSSA